MIYFVTNRKDENLVTPSSTVKVIDTLPTFGGTGLCGFDLETDGLVFNRNRILLIILGNETDQYVIDWYGFKGKVELSQIFDKNVTYLGHNLLFDLPFIMREGVDIDADKVYDTMVVEQILTKGTKLSVSLKATLDRRLKVTDVDKDIRKEFVAMKSRVPIFDNRHIEYAAGDVKYLFGIRNKQVAWLKRLNQEQLADLNNKNVVISSRMKVTGAHIDKTMWLGLYSQMIDHCDQLELKMDDALAKVGLLQRKKRRKVRHEQLNAFGGMSTPIVNKNVNNINYASPSQLVQIFKQLGLPVPKESKEDKDSIGEATLQQYLIEHDTPLEEFIHLLIDYKVSVKLASSFGIKWVQKHVDDNDRIHPTFSVNATATGRFKCQNPNLQNIPSNINYRKCFTAEKGYKIWTCDYSSAELRILASLSRDEVMLRILSEGGDLHGYVGTPVYRYIYNDKEAIVSKKSNPEFRTSIKNVIFGILYGAGIGKIGELLNISKSRAEKVYAILEKTYPQAFEYLGKMSKFGVEKGYVIIEPKMNQRRYFKEFEKGYLISKERGVIERASKNTPIQGTNGQMMKLALVYVDEYIRENKLESRIISTIHDEMVVEVREGEEEHCLQFERLMKRAGDEFLDGVEMETESKLLNYWSK